MADVWSEIGQDFFVKVRERKQVNYLTFWVGATMPTGAMPTTVIPTQFLSDNNANNNNPDINIDSNNSEK